MGFSHMGFLIIPTKIMRLTTLSTENNYSHAAIRVGSGYILIKDINKHFNSTWNTELYGILVSGEYYLLKQWYDRLGEDELKGLPIKINVRFGRLIGEQHPVKIVGIGLNYQDHARDLQTTPPTKYPGCFIKTPNTLTAPGGQLILPKIAEKTTGEGELVLVFTKKSRNVPSDQWIDHVAFTASIDGTIERPFLVGSDSNPRNLTAAKIFDTSFVVGPELISTDELSTDPMDIEVSTVLNGKVWRKNQVKNMVFKPGFLVEFFTKFATFNPGDMISTGTPGAASLSHGDIISCRIKGLGDFPELYSPVIDLKIDK
ncbi:MAG: FAA hydrolase family protein [Bacteroidetes bacterium]|nr:MAG: FAA hydrolase family protein [Bacteroidota bacterium]